MKRIFSSRLFGIGAIALFALALAGIGATAVAQGHSGRMQDPPAPAAVVAPRAPMMTMAPGVTDAMMPGGPMGGRGGDRMLDRLDLSDQQREAIGKLREDGKTAALPLRKEMMRARNELRGEMLKDDPNAQRVREIAKRIGDLRTELQLQSIDQRLAIRKLLTPEQRDQTLTMGRGFDPEGGDEARGPGRRGGMGGPRGGTMMCKPGGDGGQGGAMMCMPGAGGEGGAMMCMPGAGGEGDAMMCMPGGGCSMMSQGGPNFQVMPEGGWGQGGAMMCKPGGGGKGSPMMCMPDGSCMMMSQGGPGCQMMPQGGCGQGGAMMMCKPGGGCGEGGAMMCKPGGGCKMMPQGGCGHEGQAMKARHGGRGRNADDGAKCGKCDRGDKRGKHDKRDKNDDEGGGLFQ